jgi:hypothetical protein
MLRLQHIPQVKIFRNKIAIFILNARALSHDATGGAQAAAALQSESCCRTFSKWRPQEYLQGYDLEFEIYTSM